MFNQIAGIVHQYWQFLFITIMNILVTRIAKKSNYTIGKLYIDDKYYCDTIEDKDRNLNNAMSSKEIKKTKVNNKTAIPTGTYDVTLKTKSPKYSKSQTFVKYCNAYMPRILNVPGFDGILLHTGNTAEDSSGCIILGYNKQIGKVVNSMDAFKKVYPILKKASDEGQRISITIK